MHSLGTFISFFSGELAVIPENDYLKNGKELYDAASNALLNIEGLVVDIESVEHIQTRLLGSSPVPGAKIVAILLLNDKNETPVMYQSLAYRHRSDGVVFGECRGTNVAKLSKELGVDNYPSIPYIFAITGDSASHKIERLDGKSVDPDSLSKWVNKLLKKQS